MTAPCRRYSREKPAGAGSPNHLVEPLAKPHRLEAQIATFGPKPRDGSIYGRLSCQYCGHRPRLIGRVLDQLKSHEPPVRDLVLPHDACTVLRRDGHMIVKTEGDSVLRCTILWPARRLRGGESSESVPHGQDLLARQPRHPRTDVVDRGLEELLRLVVELVRDIVDC
jgi:hypothetical protein